MLNPVPIAPTFHDDTDLKIAVNLGGLPDDVMVLSKGADDSGLSTKISNYFKEVALPEVFTSRANVYKIADQSFDAMQGTIARMKLASYPPDVEIEIPRNLCGTLEFDIADEVIKYGYDLCDKIMKEASVLT